MGVTKDFHHVDISITTIQIFFHIQTFRAGWFVFNGFTYTLQHYVILTSDMLDKSVNNSSKVITQW